VNPADRNATTILGRLARRDRAVSESLSVRTFVAGEKVCRSRDLFNSLCLVVSGRVQLFRTTRNRRRLAVATLGPGSMFGEESLLGWPQEGTYAVALEPGTLWIFPTQRALEISSTNAMFGFGLVQAMGQRLVETEDRLEQVAYGTIASRLAALLLELGGDDPDHAVRATHRELADMLSTWRETISKTMQEFRRRGWVASGRRKLVILDRQSLQEASTATSEPN
jgi:CRP/FNR family cyclic AMP-dependent transcriptional regulator